jgi:hypothetical protein
MFVQNNIVNGVQMIANHPLLTLTSISIASQFGNEMTRAVLEKITQLGFGCLQMSNGVSQARQGGIGNAMIGTLNTLLGSVQVVDTTIGSQPALEKPRELLSWLSEIGNGFFITKLGYDLTRGIGIPNKIVGSFMGTIGLRRIWHSLTPATLAKFDQSARVYVKTILKASRVYVKTILKALGDADVGCVASDGTMHHYSFDNAYVDACCKKKAKEVFYNGGLCVVEDPHDSLARMEPTERCTRGGYQEEVLVRCDSHGSNSTHDTGSGLMREEIVASIREECNSQELMRWIRNGCITSVD